MSAPCWIPAYIRRIARASSDYRTGGGMFLACAAVITLHAVAVILTVVALLVLAADVVGDWFALAVAIGMAYLLTRAVLRALDRGES